MPTTITSYVTFSANTKARASQVNTNFSNHRGDLIPINENTASSANLTYDIGTSDKQWKRAYIESGYWKAGDIKARHNYNGTAGNAGQGWFLCNGLTINSTNYEAQDSRSAGDWATYVGTSSLEGLLSPNLTNKFLIGDTVTTQGGTTTVTSVGNTGNTIDIEHAHTTPDHNHTWYVYGATVAARSYDANGGQETITGSNLGTGATTVTGISVFNDTTSGGLGIGRNLYTSSENTSTANSLNQNTDITPESIKVQYWIRII